MSQNILIYKNPGDASIFHLKESLARHDEPFVAVELMGNDMISNLGELIEDKLSATNGEALTVVLDVFMANNAEKFLSPIQSIIDNRRIAGIEISSTVAVIAIVNEAIKDTPEAKSLERSCVHVIPGRRVEFENPGRIITTSRGAPERKATPSAESEHSL